MMSTNEYDVLFDDRTVLNAALGKNALKISAINADCDCDGYYSSLDNEDLDSHQIAPAAASTY